METKIDPKYQFYVEHDKIMKRRKYFDIVFNSYLISNDIIELMYAINECSRPREESRGAN